MHTYWIIYVINLMLTHVLIPRVKAACAKQGTQLIYSETGNVNLTTIRRTAFKSCISAARVELSHNAIGVLSDETFKDLYNVKYLDISHNKITTLPPFLLQTQRNLKVLNISYNSISTIPVRFLSHKYELDILDLSYNSIQTISLKAFKLFYSNTVDLSHNDLRIVEPWPYVTSFDRIETFDLRYNNISAFSNTESWTFQELPDTLLDLRHNAFTEWHDLFLMQYFDNSHLQSIDVLIGKLNIDLRDNDWNCDCNIHHMASSLKGKFYSYNNADLLQLKCQTPQNLHDLRIFYDVNLKDLICDIKQDCPKDCICIDIPEFQLVRVDCRRRNLVKMPEILPFKKYLNVELYLDNNSISSIEEKAYTKYISKLSMTSNQLNVLKTEVMKTLSNEIRHLDFRNNSLQSIPKEMQVLPYENVKISSNQLKCDCAMTWMATWIQIAPKKADKELECKDSKGQSYKIVNINNSVLTCSRAYEIGIVIVCSIALVAVIILLIAARRCPYETKVIIFKFFNLHPSDKYEVDVDDGMEHDLYVSFDEEDIHVRQWIRTTLAKRLEDFKPHYKLFIPLRNLKRGVPEADARIEQIEKSRRMVIVLTSGFMENEWNEYEVHQSEILDKNKGRVFYILYDKNGENLSKKDPWRSKIEQRKVFSPDDRMFWAKLRYELPLKNQNCLI